jgi:hypothetical protein
MLGDAPSSRGRVLGLSLIVLACIVVAAITLAGGSTGSGFASGSGYTAFPAVVIFGLLLVREIRRLK